MSGLRRPLIRLLAGVLCLAGVSAAAAEQTPAAAPPTPVEPQSAPAAPPESGAVMLTIVPEGGRVTPPPVDRRAEQQAAANQSVLASVANLRRVAVFAIQFLGALLLAGLAGALIAGLLSLRKNAGLRIEKH